MKVLLADDQPAARLGVRSLLRHIEELEIVGETAYAGEVVRLAEELRPDLVVLDPDIEEPVNGSGGVCRGLKSLANPPRVLVYTVRNSKEDIAAASLAGADSYLYKKVKGERLAEAIERTCSGQRIWLLGPMESNAGNGFQTRLDGANLTPREKEILALLINCRNNKEIAEDLLLSGNTVKTHVRNILKELGLKNRQELFEADAH